MKKQPAPEVVSDINVTPMVDVMLVLLIIFMVITPMLNKGVQVELVKAKNSITMKDADKEDAIIVFITREGRLVLSPGNSNVSMEDIPSRVSDLLTNRLDKTVYIHSDARARYRAVEDVVDGLRGAGVDQIGLITETRQNQPEARGPAVGFDAAYAAR